MSASNLLYHVKMGNRLILKSWSPSIWIVPLRGLKNGRRRWKVPEGEMAAAGQKGGMSFALKVQRGCCEQRNGADSRSHKRQGNRLSPGGSRKEHRPADNLTRAPWELCQTSDLWPLARQNNKCYFKPWSQGKLCHQPMKMCTGDTTWGNVTDLLFLI